MTINVKIENDTTSKSTVIVNVLERANPADEDRIIDSHKLFPGQWQIVTIYDPYRTVAIMEGAPLSTAEEEIIRRDRGAISTKGN